MVTACLRMGTNLPTNGKAVLVERRDRVPEVGGSIPFAPTSSAGFEKRCVDESPVKEFCRGFGVAAERAGEHGSDLSE